GQGTVYLLSRRKRLAVGTLLMLLAASLAAAYLVFAEPLNAGAYDPRMPLGVQYRAILPSGAAVRKLTPVFNIYGTFTLIGGALYSSWLLWRKEIVPGRVIGNLLIAAGGLSLALVSTLARLGSGGLLPVAELVGAGLMFAGFLLATGRPVSMVVAREATTCWADCPAAVCPRGSRWAKPARCSASMPRPCAGGRTQDGGARIGLPAGIAATGRMISRRSCAGTSKSARASSPISSARTARG